MEPRVREFWKRLFKAFLLFTPPDSHLPVPPLRGRVWTVPGSRSETDDGQQSDRHETGGARTDRDPPTGRFLPRNAGVPGHPYAGRVSELCATKAEGCKTREPHSPCV